MSAGRKYAALPDLDAAPDTYETPDLTDDASTIPGSSLARPESQASSYEETDENVLTGISRRRLDPDEARSHFLPSGQDSAASRYNSRIQSKRKSYKESGRRGRLKGVATSGTETSSDEDEESLETRLARLRREAAEVRAAFESRKTHVEPGTQPKREAYDDGLNELSEVLGSINSRGSQTEDGAASRLVKKLGTATKTRSTPTDVAEASDGHSTQADPMYTFSYAPNYDQEHALAKIADFDARLTLLENVLGLDTIALPSQPRPHAKAVLPTLEHIDRQISMISTSTDLKIDSTSRRIRQLTQDAQKLTESRKAAKAAQEALSNSRNIPPRPSSSSQADADAQSMPGIEDPEQISKINALYGTLPTIEALSPMLPPLLDRLRSLRSVHAEAAGAQQGLARIESRQEAMAEDLRSWRAGLEKVEEMFEQGQKTMGGNMGAIEGWVKELEGRMGKLGK
ncbi:MAG: hypothetical protein HETSPECPRED_008580 [Heterodermia speciosa]|uniref:Dynactin subunit n=1 Tax=Heterodermia speciosa TaxID=116794 RepID=A0A8H3IYQ9_9LECA|nr:MAG: hypothetical protein HETSPECPRED_008580 [Heterodermia speciosa]